MTKLGIAIITPDGVLRNDQLKFSLENLAKILGISPEVVFTGFDGRCGWIDVFDQINQDANLSLLGRKLTNPESACLLSHRKAYSEIKVDWLLVVEDDMQIFDVGELFELLTALRDTSHLLEPSILLLFSGKNGVYSVKDPTPIGAADFFSIKRLPTSTCAYLINRAAMVIGTKDEKVSGAADWPTWSMGLNFRISDHNFFTDQGLDNSLIANESSEFSKTWPRYRFSFLIQLKDIASNHRPALVGGRRNYFKLFVMPLIWWRLSSYPFLRSRFRRTGD